MTTIDEHAIRKPEWLERLVELVLDCVTPFGFIGPIGYRWWDPGQFGNPYDAHQVAAFPTAYVVDGGREDGERRVSGFDLDLSKLLSGFDEISSVAWHTPASYNGDLDGPEVRVQGRFAGTDACLRLFHVPPPDEPAYFAVTPTGDAKARF